MDIGEWRHDRIAAGPDFSAQTLGHEEIIFYHKDAQAFRPHYLSGRSDAVHTSARHCCWTDRPVGTFRGAAGCCLIPHQK